MRKHLFTLQVTELMLPTEAEGSLTLKLFKSCLDMILGNLLWMALLEQGALDQMTSRNPLQHKPSCDQDSQQDSMK